MLKQKEQEGKTRSEIKKKTTVIPRFQQEYQAI